MVNCLTSLPNTYLGFLTMYLPINFCIVKQATLRYLVSTNAHYNSKKSEVRARDSNSRVPTSCQKVCRGSNQWTIWHCLLFFFCYFKPVFVTCSFNNVWASTEYILRRYLGRCWSVNNAYSSHDRCAGARAQGDAEVAHTSACRHLAVAGARFARLILLLNVLSTYLTVRANITLSVCCMQYNLLY